MPTVWSQIMLSLSIITTCIPSLKRVISDLRSGAMSNPAIPEPFEMGVTGKSIASGHASSYPRSTLGTRIANRLGLSSGTQPSSHQSTVTSSTGGSRNQEKQAAHRPWPHSGKAAERSESVENLRENSISRQVTFRVEYVGSDGAGAG